MPYDILLTRVVLISVLVNVRLFCDICTVSSVGCDVSRSGPNDSVALKDRGWTLVSRINYERTFIIEFTSTDPRAVSRELMCGVVYYALRLPSQFPVSALSRFCLKSSPPCFCAWFLSMQFTLRRCTDNTSQDLAIFCSSFRYFRRSGLNLSHL